MSQNAWLKMCQFGKLKFYHPISLFLAISTCVRVRDLYVIKVRQYLIKSFVTWEIWTKPYNLQASGVKDEKVISDCRYSVKVTRPGVCQRLSKISLWYGDIHCNIGPVMNSTLAGGRCIVRNLNDKQDCPLMENVLRTTMVRNQPNQENRCR